MDGWMHAWMDGCMHGGMDGCLHGGIEGWRDGCMHAYMHEHACMPVLKCALCSTSMSAGGME
eukprot:329001-Chlamydomonas_euryale.AAC.1